MIGQFLKNVSLLIVINILVKLLYVFGVEVKVQNVLGEVDYGIYFTLMNFVWLFQIIADFGLQNFNNSQVGAHPSLVHKYLPTILLFKAMLGILFFATVFFASYALGYWQLYRDILIVVMANQFLMSLNLYLRSNVTALGMYRWDSWFSAMDKFLMICFLVPFLFGVFAQTEFSLLIFVKCQFVALGISSLILFGFVLSKVKKLRIRWNLPLLLIIWKRSRWFALAVFLMFAYTRLDAIMIEKIHINGQQEAGIYAANYRLLDVANMIGFLCASFLIPMFASKLSAVHELRKLWRFAFRILAILYLSAVVMMLSVGDKFLDLLYIHSTDYWYDVFKFLFPSCLAWAVVYSSGALLTAQGKLKGQNILFAIGVLCNVGLNLWLIPDRGAEGAAIATLITQLLMAGGIHYLAMKSMDSMYDEMMFKRWLFYIGALVVIMLFQGKFYMPWMAKGILLFGVSLSLSFLLQLINVDDLKALKKS